MREISIPNSLTITKASSFLSATDWSLKPDEVVIRFHPRWCHLQPWVLSSLGAWSIAARREGTRITVINAKRAVYAWRFGLHRYLGVDPGAAVPSEHEEAGRFVPLRTISNSAELARLLADIVPLLHLSDSDEAKAVQYVLSEMVRKRT
jgi:hypothetical protein